MHATPDSHSQARPVTAGQRRALTLLELLLVLVILVTIFALVLPRMAFVAARRELHVAATQVRVALLKARHRAMRSGQPVLFLYAEEAPFFATVGREPSTTTSDRGPRPAAEGAAPWEQLENVQSQLEQLAGQAEDPWHIVSANLDRSPSPVRRLPRDVRFVAVATTAAAAEGTAAAPDDAGGISFATGDLLALRLPAIVFQPDGTSQDRRLVVRNARHLEYAISVRGLTGQVRLQGPFTTTDALADARMGP